MPWTDKPGGSGSNNNGGGRGPWGQPPNSSGSNKPGPRDRGGRGTSDLEELLKSGRDRFRRSGRRGGSGGGGGAEFQMPSGPVIAGGAAVALIVYLASGLYQIPPSSQGVVTTFGAYTGITGPGLNWHAPWPVQSVEKVQVLEERTVAVPASGKVSMLTADLNIVDIDISVTFRIQDDINVPEGDLPNVAKFVFNVEEPSTLVRAAAESALRQVVGATEYEPLITTGRNAVQDETREILQELLDAYHSGIRVRLVNLGEATPPTEVIGAQLDVNNAEQVAEQLQNDAIRDQNRLVEQALGEARQIELAAEAYAQQKVRDANGQAQRFESVYQQYLRAPDVTRRRIYLETMEEVLGGMNKVVIDGDQGGALPYLNLNELTRQSQGATGTRPQSQSVQPNRGQ